MTRKQVTVGLGMFLGMGFVLLGLVETTVAIRGRDSIGFFWFPTLCGGGVLVLLAMCNVVRSRRARLGCVTVGALAGSLATVWTLVVPILAVALIALVATQDG